MERSNASFLIGEIVDSTLDFFGDGEKKLTNFSAKDFEIPLFTFRLNKYSGSGILFSWT